MVDSGFGVAFGFATRESGEGLLVAAFSVEFDLVLRAPVMVMFECEFVFQSKEGSLLMFSSFLACLMPFHTRNWLHILEWRHKGTL